MSNTSAIQELRKAAERGRRSHYAPYSEFLVLAAVETDDGQFFGGANLEIANYSLTKHAEELAIIAALQEGQQDPHRRWLRRLYVAGGPPCGSCRQFAWEFGRPESTCIQDRVEQDWLQRHSLEELEKEDQCVELRFDALLPGAFGPETLGKR